MKSYKSSKKCGLEIERILVSNVFKEYLDTIKNEDEFMISSIILSVVSSIDESKTKKSFPTALFSRKIGPLFKDIRDKLIDLGLIKLHREAKWKSNCGEFKNGIELSGEWISVTLNKKYTEIFNLYRTYKMNIEGTSLEIETAYYIFLNNIDIPIFTKEDINKAAIISKAKSDHKMLKKRKKCLEFKFFTKSTSNRSICSRQMPYIKGYHVLGNRFWTPYANLCKTLRDMIIWKDGSRMFQFDIKCCHPNIAIYLFSSNIHPDHSESGINHQVIANYLGVDVNTFKETVLQYFNIENVIMKGMPIERFFNYYYPDVSKGIRAERDQFNYNDKDHRKQVMYMMMCEVETFLMNEVARYLNQRGIPHGNLFDCVCCKEQDLPIVEKAIEYAKSALSKKYGKDCSPFISFKREEINTGERQHQKYVVVDADKELLSRMTQLEKERVQFTEKKPSIKIYAKPDTSVCNMESFLGLRDAGDGFRYLDGKKTVKSFPLKMKIEAVTRKRMVCLPETGNDLSRGSI